MRNAIAVVLLAGVLSAEANTGATAFVFLNPETSSFWRTSEGGSVTVPVDYPEGATSASLSVEGIGHAAAYENITTSLFSFSVPEPATMAAENVYTLTLSFDDAAKTVRTAKIGVVMGVGSTAGTTRCVSPSGTRAWKRVKADRAVLPIPYGVESVTVDGVETSTGLNGAQGWFALGRFSGREGHSVEIPGYDAIGLVCGLNGLMVLLK